MDQHSNWRSDPVGRLAATSGYLATISFGDRAAAERAAARVRRVHEHITGTDTITGRPYAASDPALLLWVHATLVESGIVAAESFGTPLSADDGDRYVAEMTAAAELVGIPAGLAPASLAGLRDYLASARPELRRTPAAAESMAYLLDPPGLDEDVAEIWADIKDGVLAVLPAWALEMYGYRAAVPDRSTADRDPAGARRPRRGVPRRARGTRGPAADHPADARRAAGVTRSRRAARGRAARGQTARTARQAAIGAPAVRGGAAPAAAARRGPPAKGRGRLRLRRGTPRCAWPHVAGHAMPATPRGCSRRPARTGSSCATTLPCRPPRTSRTPWAP